MQHVEYHIRLLLNRSCEVTRISPNGKRSRPLGCVQSELGAVLGPGATPEIVADILKQLKESGRVIVEIPEP